MTYGAGGTSARHPLVGLVPVDLRGSELVLSPTKPGDSRSTSLDPVKSLLAGGTIQQSEELLLALTTGRFYTHEFIGRRLAKATIDAISGRLGSPIRIVDPFCGDGRLVSWFLEALSGNPMASHTEFSVELWDCDGVALEAASNRVKALAGSVKTLSVASYHWDTFSNARDRFGMFDVVLTNPPWELLKPDPRQLRGMDEERARDYSRSLRDEDRRLSALYPASRPRVRYAGWGLNLSRCGTEVALSLLKPDGFAGIVVPASLFADSSSSGIRQILATSFQLLSMDYFPSEARLFPGTDQPAVATLVRRRASSGVSLQLTVFDAALHARDRSRLKISNTELERTDFVIPGQLSARSYPIFRKLWRFCEFSALEGVASKSLVAGRELDETRIGERLADSGTHLFVKGRMVTRFGTNLESAKFVIPGTGIPTSAGHWRIAWRDVSRTTQARRVQASLIPPGVVTGNSLSVAYFRDDNMHRLRALLLLMTSAVFEFQVRMYLATPHISLASVRKGRLPTLQSKALVDGLARICDKCMTGKRSALIEGEVRSAQAYGITRVELETILAEFGRLSCAEKSAIVDSSCWDSVPSWVSSSTNPG